MAELITVTATPQGTADVFIGDMHIKTFGGPAAQQAGYDFKSQIEHAMETFNAVDKTFNKSVSNKVDEDKTNDGENERINTQRSTKGWY